MFLIYSLTLSIFPGFLSEDTGSHSLGTWYVITSLYLRNPIHGVTKCSFLKTQVSFHQCQVCRRTIRDVQCGGSDWKIHSAREVPETGVEKGTNDRDPFPVLARPGILFHSQVRRPRLDDNTYVLLGPNKRLSHRLCTHFCAKGIQGLFNCA